MEYVVSFKSLPSDWKRGRQVLPEEQSLEGSRGFPHSILEKRLGCPRHEGVLSYKVSTASCREPFDY